MHITCYSCVSMYRIMGLEFYRHCFFFYAILPSWMTWSIFSTYSLVYLMVCHLNVKIHNQSVATFETCMLFGGLCSTHGVITKGFFKAFYEDQKLVFQGDSKTQCKFPFPWAQPFHWVTKISGCTQHRHI
jgi:hypothetical protein